MRRLRSSAGCAEIFLKGTAAGSICMLCHPGPFFCLMKQAWSQMGCVSCVSGVHAKCVVKRVCLLSCVLTR